MGPPNHCVPELVGIHSALDRDRVFFALVIESDFWRIYRTLDVVVGSSASTRFDNSLLRNLVQNYHQFLGFLYDYLAGPSGSENRPGALNRFYGGGGLRRISVGNRGVSRHRVVSGTKENARTHTRSS